MPHLMPRFPQPLTERPADTSRWERWAFLGDRRAAIRRELDVLLKAYPPIAATPHIEAAMSDLESVLDSIDREMDKIDCASFGEE